MTEQYKLDNRQLARCVFCGRTLTNPESINEFMGPNCAKKYNYLTNYIFNPLDEDKFNSSCQTAEIQINLSSGINDGCKQILNHLSRGMDNYKAEAALEAIKALGYPSLATVVGASLVISGYDHVNTKGFGKKAYVTLHEERFYLEADYILKDHWSEYLSDCKSIYGYRFNFKERITSYPALPQTAKGLIKLFAKWYPAAELPEVIIQRSKFDDVIIKKNPTEDEAYIKIHDEGIAIGTPFSKAFIKDLKAVVPGYNKRFSKTEKAWIVKDFYIDEALQVTIDHFPKCKIDDLLKEKRKEIEEIVDLSSSTGIEEEITLPGGKCFPFQSAGVKFLNMKVSDSGGVILGDDMGLGKEQPNSSKIITSKGWKKIGNAKINDSVYTMDGTLAKITGVFPQGKKDIYKITFSDGVTARCGLEHLWLAQTSNDFCREKGFRTLTTKELIHCMKTTKDKWRIPLTKPIEFNEAKLPIPPYILGVLISDGSLVDGTRFTPGDLEVPSMVEKYLDDSMTMNMGGYTKGNKEFTTSTPFYLSGKINKINPYLNAIRNMGLNVTGEYKFIPKKYLKASIEQRKQLLAGLLDTDGRAYGARTRFSSSSKKLVKNIITLVRSLGGIAKIGYSPEKDIYKDGEFIRTELPHYYTTVLTAFNPFSVKSTRKRWKRSSKLIRQIKSIEKDGVEEATCIMVDHPTHTYITEKYVVTHNTVQFLAFVNQDRASRFPALVTCPSGVKLNWAEKIKLWIGKDVSVIVINQDKYYHIDDNGKKIRGSSTVNSLVKLPDITIVNYDVMKKHQEILMSLPFQTVCLDEGHYIKEYKSKRSQATAIVAKKIPRRIIMTGTPMLNRPRELWHLLHVCDDVVWKWFTSFGAKYCDPIKTRWGTTYNGATNLDDLNKRIMGHYMIRRRKTEVLKDLPDKIVSSINVEIPTDKRKEYDVAITDFREWALSVGGRDKLARVLRAEAIAKLVTLRKLASQSKAESFVNHCLDWMESNDEEQLICFAHHKDAIDLLESTFKKNNIAVTTIRGTDNDDQKQVSIKAFASGEKRVLVASILAAGTGVDGLQVCQNIKVLERTWVPAQMLQAEDRIYRIGQENTCFIEYYNMIDSIDSHMENLVAEKIKIIEHAIDGINVTIDDIKMEIVNSILDKKAA